MEGALAAGGDTRPPEIVAYSVRRKTRRWLVVSIFNLVAFGVGLLAVPLVVLFFPVNHTIKTVLIATAAEVVILGMEIINIATTRLMHNLLNSTAPTLVISVRGIHVGKMLGPSEIDLPWNEIAAVFQYRGGGRKAFCVCPPHSWSFLTRFDLLTRLQMFLSLPNGAPVVVPQSFLNLPIEDVLQQLRENYAETLEQHGVQILPTRTSQSAAVRR